jgi:hypothetical protein
MANENELKKYHFIYKTTNLLNGRYYVGMHSTANLKDGYLGSGTQLRRAIRKYGKEAFEIVILEFLPNRVLLVKREKEIVNEQLVDSLLCMNLKPGGLGGLNNATHAKNFQKGGNIAFTNRLLNDKEYRLAYSRKCSESMMRRRANGEVFKTPDWIGRKHREDTIQKMKESAKGRGMGATNSQYGTMWITDGENNKKIKKEDLIPTGWYKGRK